MGETLEIMCEATPRRRLFAWRILGSQGGDYEDNCLHSMSTISDTETDESTKNFCGTSEGH